MTAPYTGDPTGLTPNQVPVITDPTDTDVFNAALMTVPLNKLADFVAYLQANAPLLAAANAFTGANVLSNLLTANGASGDTNAVIDTTATPTNYKLLWRFKVGSTVKGRLYANNSNGFEIVLNAAWNGTNWTRDDNTQQCFRTTYYTNTTKSGLVLYRLDTAIASPFADGSWATVRTSIPAPGAILSCRGKFTTDGIGGIVLNESVNVKSCVIAGSTVVVTFLDVANHVNADYSIFLSAKMDTTNRLIMGFDSQLAASFSIRAIKDDGGTTHNFATLAAVVSFGTSGDLA